jgi:uncharacterized protein (DUF2062 family)
VFKRRDRRGIGTVVLGALWPRGGWGRAALYVKHRLRRLPDTPRKIARGIMAGVITTFTPFYGVHFVLAALLAFVLRGNVMAALLGTFFGNPLTYLPIAVVSLNLGHWMLGTVPAAELDESVFEKFAGAGHDLAANAWAWAMGRPVDWTATWVFWHDVFWPWTVGGIVPGVITGVAAYAVSLPLIEAYQRRRRGRIAAKLAAIRARAAEKAAAKVGAKKAGAAAKRRAEEAGG